MKPWRWIQQSPGVHIAIAYLMAVGLGLFWVEVENRDLLNTEPRALVYRAGFAGGCAIVLGFTLAKTYLRLRRLERRVESLESSR